MFWVEKVLQQIDGEGEQVINDSKTPSGRVHVGALRGVLIHDAVYRVLKERGIPVRYKFGVDDYDPLDELPSGQREYFEPYLGVPLTNVPAPPSSGASDMAAHYMREFFDVFRELGVGAETYRMSDIYRSGTFNEPIDTILTNAATVRRIYKEVSKSERPDRWYPFQAICEQCGRIGTTEVVAYERHEVVYRCRADLVTWAVGCGYAGKLSPFNGNGKLPWKLEWVAKWNSFPVTIEGAGKDHTTRGGSREVAAHCLLKIFNKKPPINIPYEFFLVGGAKMSSSRGIGTSAREMADFLPPEVLRFLVLRTQPTRPVNFSLSEEYIVKLFNDFDRCRLRAFEASLPTRDDKMLYPLSEVAAQADYYSPSFQLILTLVQMPHLDIVTEMEKRRGPLTDIELTHLSRRVRAAQYWLERYADDDQKLHLQDRLPAAAQELTAAQRAYLHKLADALSLSSWNEELIQSKVFETARLTPLDEVGAFQAIYRVLLDRESGPKAGNLLAFLDREFVIGRFKELPYSKVAFWRETGMTVEQFEVWIREHTGDVIAAQCRMELLATELDLSDRSLMAGIGVIEFLVTVQDSKTYMKRVIFNQFKGTDLDFNQQTEYLSAYGSEFIQEIAKELAIDVKYEGGCRSVCESLTGILTTRKLGVYSSRAWTEASDREN